MKITKSQLKQIIKEELESVLQEIAVIPKPKPVAPRKQKEAVGGWDPARVEASNPKGAYGNRAWWAIHGDPPDNPDGDGTWKTGPS